jgi:hypothetical protein
VGRGGAAGDRVPAGGVPGGGIALRVGGVGYLFMKQFHSSRRRRWPWKNNSSGVWHSTCEFGQEVTKLLPDGLLLM